MVKKKYSGYSAYDYLDHKDLEHIELCNGDKRVEEYLIPLSSKEEERVNILEKELIYISLHDHPVLFPEDMIKDGIRYSKRGRQSCAYESLSRSYIDGVFDNMMDGTSMILSHNGWKWEEVLFDLGMRLCDIAHQDLVIQCRGVEDIISAKNKGKIAFIPALESSQPIENELDRIDVFYGLGIRSMGITYSNSNLLGSGGKEKLDGGLTNFGKEAVERMNKVGMLIDCAHTGSRTAIDTIKYSKDPIILSHVGAKALWDSNRLFEDEVLKLCASRGGVIGISAAPHTTITYKNSRHSIDSVMEHFEYIVDLVGIENVAFGPDTFYGDHVKFHEAFSSIYKSSINTKIDRVEYVKGMENPTESSKNILRYLIKTNRSDKEIAKVLGGNVIQLLRNVWK